MKRLLRFGVCWVLFMVGLVGAAWAQNSAMSNPTQAIQQGSTPDGLAESIMQGLLGGAFRDPFTISSGPSTIFGAMFLAFNMFVFAAAVAWATYGVAAGIVQTAHEGVVLGKRLNAIWMPIRLVTGVGSLVPVFGGFSLSQAIMIMALGWGINGANYVTNKGIEALSNYTPMVNPPTARGMPASSAYDLATALFFQQLCKFGYEKHASEMRAEGVAVAPDSRIMNTSGGFASIVGKPGAVGSMYGTPQDPAACMAVGIAPKKYTAPQSSDLLPFRNRSVNYEAINQSAWARYSSSFERFKASVEALAAEYKARVDAEHASGGQKTQYPRDQLRALAAQFTAAIPQPEAQGIGSAIQQSTIDQIKGLGFLSLGMYHSMLSEANSAFAAAQDAAEYVVVNNQGSPVGEGALDALAGLVSSTSSKDFYLAAAAKAYKESSGGLTNSGRDPQTLLDYETASGANSNSLMQWNLGQDILNYALGMVVHGATGGAAQFRMVDPIITAKNVGDYMMGVSSAIIVSSGVADVLQKFGAGKFAQAAGKVVDFFTKDKNGESRAFAWVMPAAWIMLFLGIMMSLYIPFVPFLNWVAAMVQYISTVVQAFVAAPLWSFAHVAVDGEGMGQRAERGYLFLLLVLFKPVLMVIAFFAASGMVILIGSAVTWLYLPAVSQVQGNSVTGIFSVLALLVIYFIILNTVIQGSFNLVEEISDDVIGWVGQAGKSGVGRGMDERAGTMILGGLRSTRGDAMSIAGAAKGAVRAASPVK